MFGICTLKLVCFLAFVLFVRFALILLHLYVFSFWSLFPLAGSLWVSCFVVSFIHSVWFFLRSRFFSVLWCLWSAVSLLFSRFASFGCFFVLCFPLFVSLLLFRLLFSLPRWLALFFVPLFSVVPFFVPVFRF